MLKRKEDPRQALKPEIDYFNLFYHICGLTLCSAVIYFSLVSIWLGAPKSSAELGDMFGAIGAVFAGLAFAGVVVTILIQQRELKETREELAKSAIAQDESQKALKDQLLSMQLTTKIESLQSYKATITPTNSSQKDLIKVTEKIIARITHDIFKMEENSDIVNPVLSIRLGRATRTSYGVLLNFPILIENTGGPTEIIFNEFNDSIKLGNGINHKYPYHLNVDASIPFLFNEKTKFPVIIRFTSKGIILGHESSFILHVDRPEKEVIYKLTPF